MQEGSTCGRCGEVWLAMAMLLLLSVNPGVVGAADEADGVEQQLAAVHV